MKTEAKRPDGKVMSLFKKYCAGLAVLLVIVAIINSESGHKKTVAGEWESADGRALVIQGGRLRLHMEDSIYLQADFPQSTPDLEENDGAKRINFGVLSARMVSDETSDYVSTHCWMKYEKIGGQERLVVGYDGRDYTFSRVKKA